jgi:hypothetical protein
LPTPGIGPLPVAALEDFKKFEKGGKQLPDLQFVEWPDHAEISSATREKVPEIFVKPCLKPETFRVLMIDLLSPILNVSLFRTPFVCNDKIGVTVQKKANSACKSQLCGEGRVPVEVPAPVQFQESGTNRAPNNDRI